MINLLKKIRKALHRLFSCVIGGLYRLLSNICPSLTKVVVYMDGGICSQMHQYMIGQIYKDRGYDVYYDLKWFDQCGMDVDGKYERLYELEEAFPYLEVKKINGVARFFYRMFLCYVSSNMQLPYLTNKVKPIYLGGYYIIPPEYYIDVFKRIFKLPVRFIPKDGDNKTLRCAIHVRRGDLAKGDIAFYGGCSDSYFFNAIEYVEKNNDSVEYVFFSDEMEYVIENIIPHVHHLNYKIATSKKAYEDLLEIASCDIIIASQGTFGKMGSMFNDSSCLILKDDREELNKVLRIQWAEYKRNVVFITD